MCNVPGPPCQQHSPMFNVSVWLDDLIWNISLLYILTVVGLLSRGSSDKQPDWIHWDATSWCIESLTSSLPQTGDSTDRYKI